MRKIIRFQCGLCKKEYLKSNDCLNHELVCEKERVKTEELMVKQYKEYYKDYNEEVGNI